MKIFSFEGFIGDNNQPKDHELIKWTYPILKDAVLHHAPISGQVSLVSEILWILIRQLQNNLLQHMYD
jgi:hypothetical protein